MSGLQWVVRAARQNARSNLWWTSIPSKGNRIVLLGTSWMENEVNHYSTSDPQNWNGLYVYIPVIRCIQFKHSIFEGWTQKSSGQTQDTCSLPCTRRTLEKTHIAWYIALYSRKNINCILTLNPLKWEKMKQKLRTTSTSMYMYEEKTLVLFSNFLVLKLLSYLVCRLPSKRTTTTKKCLVSISACSLVSMKSPLLFKPFPIVPELILLQERVIFCQFWIMVARKYFYLWQNSF